MSDNKFHDHLDVCKRCEQQPFNLCPVGDLLIRAEVAKITPAPLPATPLKVADVPDDYYWEALKRLTAKDPT
jgi:hypothetical protein